MASMVNRLEVARLKAFRLQSECDAEALAGFRDGSPDAQAWAAKRDGYVWAFVQIDALYRQALKGSE